MDSRVVPIDIIGECKRISPFVGKERSTFVTDQEGVIYNVHQNEIFSGPGEGELTFFELAGPREKTYYDPARLTCGIVTCGGLCPGLNDVIHSVVEELYDRYGVKRILGFKYGYWGLADDAPEKPVDLVPDNILDLHRKAGTVLASSRGSRDIGGMVESLKKHKVQVLFVIGGDGTMRGASEINKYIKEQGLKISIISIPKTIDNDIVYVSRSFGFYTAVQEADKVIECAHVEANGAFNGIGLVKLMGRHSGYIAAHTTLSNSDVNFCLIPEVPFNLEGDGGLFDSIEKRIDDRGHAVIVVAEGAGQELIANDPDGERKDASGNRRLKDIGVFLKEKINSYFLIKGKEINVKYIDPSYIIRSVPANAMDSTYCLMLGQNAVHAAMSGRTNMMVGYWNHHFIHVPISMAIEKRNQVNPSGRLWKSVMEATLQPESIFS